MATAAHQPKILLPILLLAVCVGLGVYYAVSQRSIVCGDCAGSADNLLLVPDTDSIDADMPQPATLTGVYLCLPHVNVDGPQTEECAFGIQTDDGAYYAINFSAMSQLSPMISAGQRITASGVVTPIERLSTDHWRKYPISGIFLVTHSMQILK